MKRSSVLVAAILVALTGAAGAQGVADDFPNLLRMLDDVFAQRQAAQ